MGYLKDNHIYLAVISDMLADYISMHKVTTHNDFSNTHSELAHKTLIIENGLLTQSSFLVLRSLDFMISHC